MGNNYYANGGDGAYGTTYSAHTGLNGLHGVPTAAALPVASTKANQPITQMQAKNLYDAFYNDGLFDNSKGTILLADPAQLNGLWE
jgi:hypothetical protein